MQDILKLLEDLNQGALMRDANTRLAEMVKAVEENRGTGVITIKLKVEPNEDDTVSVCPDITIKKPQRQRPPSLFFLSSGKLYKQDPRQMSLTSVDNVSKIKNGDNF